MLPVADVVEYNDDNERLCAFLCCWELSGTISKLNNADAGRRPVWFVGLAAFEYWLFNARNSSTNILIWLLTVFARSTDATRM